MDKINLLIGSAGIIATNIPAYIESVPQIVSIICSAVITLSTCFLQIYHMWKNRDKIQEKTDPKDEDVENG